MNAPASRILLRQLSPSLLVVALMLPTVFAVAADWPQFRGPGGSGVAPDGALPVDFGPEKNVVWKLALPLGNSSPCVVGDKIFLTAFAEGKLLTICVDRQRGEILWQRDVPPGEIERGSRLSNPASATAAADSERVYVYFAPFGLISYDHTGREIWRHPLPTPITGHGASASPVIAGDRVVLACDQDGDSFLLTVDRKTGRTGWRVRREGYRRCFSTPLVWPPDSPRIVVLAGTLRLAAYDLADGSERWTVGGLPNELVSSPIGGDGMVYCAGWTHGSGVDEMPTFDSLLKTGDRDGDEQLTREEAPDGPARRHFHYIDADSDGRLTRTEYDVLARIFDAAENALIAVRLGGKGDVTESHVVWKATKQLPYVPSPLLYQGRLFTVKNGGIASCYDAKTGRKLFMGRLGAVGNYYASPVAAGGKICVASEPGVLIVLKAADTLGVLARNELGEAILASPAIVGDRLYVRTEKHLYAFGSPSSARD